MVLGRVDAIHSDGIDPKLLKVWQVTLAGACIGKRVNVGGGFKERVVGTSYDRTYSKLSVS